MAALEAGLRTILAAVFAVAFVSKAHSRAAYAEFAGTLADFGWLRGRRRHVVALAVPAAEAALVVLLAIPATVMAGFAMAFTMLTVFTGVTWREVAAGRPVRRCFGGGGARIGPAQLARNLVLLGCAVAGGVVAATAGGGATAWMLVLAVGGALLAATFIVHWDELATLARTP
jgi:hypothetical protein